MDKVFSVDDARLILASHRVNGLSVTADEYIRNYRRVLAKGLERTCLIYLDTNYWIWLREAELGRGSAEQCDLLRLLRAGVRSRKLLCVSHFNSLTELGKQEGVSLRVTARLLDELTEGVAMASAADLQEWDCSQFIRETVGITVVVGLFNWTKAGQMHRNTLPQTMPGPVTEIGRNAILKCLIDTFWNAKFEDIFEAFNWDTKRVFTESIDSETIAAVEDIKSKSHAQEDSREKVRRVNFRQHVVKQLKPIFAKQLLDWHVASSKSLDIDVAKKQLQLFVDAAICKFNERTLGKFLPCFALPTELYALYETSPTSRHLEVAPVV